MFLSRDQLLIDPVHEVTITPGATIGIFAAIQAVVQAGDEVIVFDPGYDSYAPAVRVAGGIPVHIALKAPNFAVDWSEVKAAIRPHTRMIIVNTPHNPTGTLWSLDDWQQLIEWSNSMTYWCCPMKSMSIWSSISSVIIARCIFRRSGHVVLWWVHLAKPFM